MPAAPTPRPEARDRVLATASALFYGKGVHAVGIDEIISQADVARATFYRHYPSKDDLIVEYLRTADRQTRDAVETAVATATDDADGVRAIAQVVAAQIGTPGFRGCAFLNAAAEYPGPEDPIHQAILAHRTWFHDAVLEQFARVTNRPAPAAAQFVMLRDGAMSEGCLGDPAAVTATFLGGVDALLAATSARGRRVRGDAARR